MFSTVAVAAWFANQLPLERAIRTRGALRLIAQTLFMPVLLHALASLVFWNLRFASFLQRTHTLQLSIQPSNPPGCNSLLRGQDVQTRMKTMSSCLCTSSGRGLFNLKRYRAGGI